MRAHTVILGAGATVAAIPYGDKNGNKSSVMSGLIEKLHLEDVPDGITLKTDSDNLEDIYSELYIREEAECKIALKELENRLYEYFDSLELPQEPTIYDLLILSLTEKDAIATFNWDPLLLQAYNRCYYITDNLPKIFCLHGSVALGYCKEHQEFGIKGAYCPICRNLLPPITLLYPVSQKNYNEDEYIRESWRAVEYMIENSYMITIFGYSAPTTDKEAVGLLEKAWGEKNDRQLEEVSVIDVVEEDEILVRWKNFIYSHHYRYTNNFFDSYLGMFPRRSCETVFSTFQFNIPADNTKGFYEGITWDEIEDKLYSLLEDEWQTPKGTNLPLYYTHDSFKERF